MQEHRLYPLERSPFYRLSSKKKIASLLKISKDELIKLSQSPTYHVFIKKGGGKEIRSGSSKHSDII
jgi:hypothetical protein